MFRSSRPSPRRCSRSSFLDSEHVEFALALSMARTMIEPGSAAFAVVCPFGVIAGPTLIAEWVDPENEGRFIQEHLDRSVNSAAAIEAIAYTRFEHRQPDQLVADEACRQLVPIDLKFAVAVGGPIDILSMLSPHLSDALGFSSYEEGSDLLEGAWARIAEVIDMVRADAEEPDAA